MEITPCRELKDHQRDRTQKTGEKIGDKVGTAAVLSQYGRKTPYVANTHRRSDGGKEKTDA
jgi:hypothetical protein